MQGGGAVDAGNRILRVDGFGDSCFELFNRRSLGDPIRLENFDDSIDVALVYGLPAIGYHWVSIQRVSQLVNTLQFRR